MVILDNLILFGFFKLQKNGVSGVYEVYKKGIVRFKYSLIILNL
jgi:hypothetical protein